MPPKIILYTQPEGNKEREGNAMNRIYINVHIINYGNGRIKCSYHESINDGPIQIKELELNKALRMVWELVLAGGKREVHINYLDPTIVTTNAYIFLANPD